MKNKENFPFINNEQTKIIISQLRRSTCKIIKENGKSGTGSFCKIPYPDQFKLLPVLMTNNHVLDENDLKKYSNIRFTIDDDNIVKNIIIDDSRIIFTDKELDVTIIEIKPYDKIIHFLDIDDEAFSEDINFNIYKDEKIYILQYPKGSKASHSVGKIKDINDINISYYCYTDDGSSGSPILVLSKFKIIGIHKQRTTFQFNQGTFIKFILDKFNSKKSTSTDLIKKGGTPSYEEQKYQYTLDYINHKINSSQLIYLLNSLSMNENKNNQIGFNNIIEMSLFNSEEIKDIYILDNTDYTDKNGIKHFHDGLKELNESNVDIYINDFKTKFKKHYFFSIGNFKIKMVFKIKMTNCKNMFYNCSNLKNIDLSSFDTKDVTDMSNMFAGCGNLKNLNLSSINTDKVTDMSYMFYGCDLLQNLDLSSFNTKNVTNMEGMFHRSFSYLYNQINLNLSSFDTRNVRNMASMFEGCENLSNIIFSHKFNTQNVTDMSKMFYSCKNLVNLDLKYFDTRNVTNMRGMFEHCSKMETLDLSSFNTENVTNMYAMFFCCTNLICLDLSSFDTRKVIDMGEMFNTCSNLVSLNLSSFNTINTKNMRNMFDFCCNLINVIFNKNVDCYLIEKNYEERNKSHASSELHFIFQ